MNMTIGNVERGLLGEYLIYVNQTCCAIAKTQDQAKDLLGTALHAYSWAFEHGTRNDEDMATKYAWWFCGKYIDDSEFWGNRSHYDSFFTNFLNDPALLKEVI